MRRIGATGIFLLLWAIALIAAAPARADGVVYTLTGSTNSTLGPVHAEGFQFTAPDFITSYTGLSESELGSCTACALAGTAIEFYPSGSIDTIVPVDLIRFTDANGVVYGFFFAPDDFSATGTYTTSDYPPYIVSNVGILTVQNTSEPPGFLLLAAGLLALVGMRKRKTPIRS